MLAGPGSRCGRVEGVEVMSVIREERWASRWWGEERSGREMAEVVVRRRKRERRGLLGDMVDGGIVGVHPGRGVGGYWQILDSLAIMESANRVRIRTNVGSLDCKSSFTFAHVQIFLSFLSTTHCIALSIEKKHRSWISWSYLASHQILEVLKEFQRESGAWSDIRNEFNTVV